jgi:membrane protease YdiL (CAAX protease family)
VPAEPTDAIGNLLTAGGIVAAVAVPLGLAGWAVAKKPLFLRWRPPAPRWTGVEVILLFLGYPVFTTIVSAILAQVGFFAAVVPEPPKPSSDVEAAYVAVVGGTAAFEPSADSIGVRKGLWTGFLAVPLLLLAGRALRTAVGSNDPSAAVKPRPAADLAIGVAGWMVLVPVVFSVNVVVIWLVTKFGGQPDTHRLAQLGPADRPLEVVVFLLSACVFGPLAEEYLFRGVLIPWATRARYGPTITLVAAGLYVMKDVWTADGPRLAPLGFLALLGLGLVLIYWMKSRIPVRTVAAVYASAAAFAAVHSAVWPSPVPLFVLGLGLGYVFVRTRRILPAVILHGFFNAISAVSVLRGDPLG